MNPTFTENQSMPYKHALPLKIQLCPSLPSVSSPKRTAWSTQHSDALSGTMVLSQEQLCQHLSKQTITLDLKEPFEVRFQQYPLANEQCELQVALGRGRTWVMFSTPVPNAALKNEAQQIPTRASKMPLIEPQECVKLWRALTQLTKQYSHPPLPQFVLQVLEKPKARPKRQTRRRVPRPSQFCTFQVDDRNPRELVIERRKVKSASSAVLMGKGIALVLGIGLLVGSIALLVVILTAGRFGILIIVVPLFTLIGVLVKWLGGQLGQIKLNRFQPVTLVVNSSRLSVRAPSLRTPLVLPTSKCSQFFATYQQKFENSGEELDDQSVSHLHVELDSGEQIMLIDTITNPPDALYLKEVLEVFLDVEPRMVIGEWTGYATSAGARYGR